MSNFEKVILKKVFFENLEITFWDSKKNTDKSRSNHPEVLNEDSYSIAVQENIHGRVLLQ